LKEEYTGIEECEFIVWGPRLRSLFLVVCNTFLQSLIDSLKEECTQIEECE
jgi:hypothetical protein